ncbi:LLM class flavin-dependent oxidoreductase [Streptomyces sp. NPDC004542]|uniref:LLM class flavin-dependent oxidoreductase n=1 Tax=Streptomyces sp. NPDC004542 TaxID=3154281 RepID=UPI00339DC783
MKFGLCFGMVVPPDGELSWADAVADFIRLAPEIESLGYDSVHVTEHHFQRDGHNSSPLTVLAAVAAVTERLELTTNILLASLYNPVKLAEDTAVVDNISRGRLRLGMAPGYVTEEFAGLMVPYETRARRFEEVMDILQAAWTNETFSYEGEFFSIPETRLMPRPVRRPHPPIWYGVSGKLMLRRAAARGAAWVGSPRHTIDELAEHLAVYRKACDETGFVPQELPIMRGVYIAETREEAERIAAPAVTHLFRELYGRKSAEGERQLRNDAGAVIEDADTVSFETFKDRYIIGSPDDAIERITALRDRLGMTELTCWTQLPGIGGADVLSSARLFAKEVIPAFRD